MNMKTKLGDWSLDVAKYLLTAILFTSVFSGMRSVWMYIGAVLLIMLFFIVGIILINSDSLKKEKI
jgi:VanZ family protein